MKYICPEYAHSFRCIADKCKDSCCVLWEIGIDDETLGKYRGISGEIGEKIRKNLDTGGDYATFKLTREGRCPMLDDCGLCEIITAFSDEYISEICREHPRFYNILPDRVEWGIGLSCEEAARLILTDGGEKFKESDGELFVCDEADRKLTDYLTFIREQIFLLLDSSPLPLNDKIRSILYYAESIGAEIESKDYGIIYPYLPLDEAQNFDTPYGFSKKSFYADIIRLFDSLEFLDPDFKGMLSKTADNIERLGISLPDELAALRLTRLLKYFLFRYLITSDSCENMLSKIKLSIILTLTIHALTENSPELEAWICASKALSKEVEYNEDNLDLLLEMTLTEAELTTERFLELLA